MRRLVRFEKRTEKNFSSSFKNVAAVNLKVVGWGLGASPMIVSYNAINSLVRLKNISSNLKKTFQPKTTLALYIVVKLEVVGLGPGCIIIFPAVKALSQRHNHLECLTCSNAIPAAVHKKEKKKIIHWKNIKV
jgi:hypothetical protein